MPTPVILVDGVAPPPLGASTNGLKTTSQVCALTLQSTSEITSVAWTVDCTPGSTATLSEANPKFPFSTTLTLNGIGTYRITATANSNQDGAGVAMATVYVLTTSTLLRIPIPGEKKEFDPTYGYHATLADAINGISTKIHSGVVTPTYGVSVTTTWSKSGYGDLATITVTNNVAFTIENPTTYSGLQIVTYKIVNTSGGAMGAITWGTHFKLAGAFTNPANNNQRAITFYQDWPLFPSDKYFIEIDRTAADAPA